jgi:molecular chaperone GrpE
MLQIDTAEKSASEAPAVATLLEGVKLTEKSLQAALARHGVCKLSPLGEPFDPHVHEAMLTIQVPVIHFAQPFWLCCCG